MSNVTSWGTVSVCGHGGWGLARSVTAIAGVGLALALPPPVQAETFDCGAGDVQCLIAAINEANANGQENTIRLEAGTYTLMNVDNNTDGPNGLPSMTSALRIVGAGRDTTTVARDASAPAFRLLHVEPTGNLTVEGVSLNGGSGINDGALFNNGGVVALMQSEVDDNAGGGLVNNGGEVDIRQSAVNRNGGTGISNNDGVVNIFQSTVDSNRSGGLSNYGEVNITESEVAHNSSSTFGGLINVGPSRQVGTSRGTVRIIRSRFSDNSGNARAGGLSAFGGTVFIANSTFDHNSADGPGGLEAYSSTLVVTDSAFVENKSILSGTGGGMVLYSTATVTNTTFAGNMFEGVGGQVPIEAIANSGTLILTNSTLADNVNSSSNPHQNATALWSPSTANTILVNTILARNTGPFSQDCLGSVTSDGNNLIGDPTGCTIDLQPTDLTGDPGLGTFQDNGEPGNGHVPLLASSPAIGAGNDDLCPPTDQLGRERTAPCDIGAVAFIEEEGAPTAQPAVAVVHTEMAGLIASLAQAVTTLKSATVGTADLFNQIKLVIDRAGELARVGASEGTSTGR